MLLFFAGSNVWADTYSHTFVTTDIPEGTTDTQFTLSDVDWTLALDGGKVSVFSNDLGAHFGTNNSTCNSVILSTQGIPGTIASVTVEASRGKNLIGTMGVTVAGTEYSLSSGETTTSLTTDNVAYEFTGGAEGEIAIVWTKSEEGGTNNKGAFYIKKITVEYSNGGVIVAKPVITPNGGTFTEPQEVTITAGEGCDIIYTTDGIEPGMAAGMRYTGPFTVSENCTVKAVAIDVTGASSSVASAEFKFLTGGAIATIAELCAADPGTVTVEFNNWIVTGVKSSNVYFTDGRNGILLYEKNHGFEVGDQLSGTATFNLTSYKNAPEITGLTATTEGVTIAAKGVTVEPIPVTIGELQTNMQGCVIKLESLTYTDGLLTDATGASITPYNTFNIDMPTLEEGKSYDATGVAVWFDKWEIAPRTTDDFVEAGGVVFVAKPVITPNGGTFAEPQTVTITAGEGCEIIYTTDGAEPGLTAGMQYTAPFTVSEDCTVKAVAIDATGAYSAVAEATFTFSAAIPSIGRLCAAATETEQTVPVVINNWAVTGVNGNQVFFTDGANGIVLYQKDHSFEVGDMLNGTASITVVIFAKNDFTYPEIMGLTATTEGVSVTKNAEIKPQAVVVSDLNTEVINQQGNLIRLEGVTYSEGKFIDGDDNTITPYNTFKVQDYPALIEGQTYNVTGVAIWFGYWEIAPRTAAEFELVTSQIAPESSWSVEEEVVDINGVPTATFTTNSDGTITYESSDESVATIDERGAITLVGKGTTVITANVAATETYLPDSKSFKLTVTVDGYTDATFAYNDEDIVGQGAPETGAELSATRNDGLLSLYANKAYAKPGDTHIKIYGSKFEGKDEDRVLTEPSYIELSVAEGYSITKIVLTATGKDYIKEWKDQIGNAAVTEEGGNTATWEGDTDKVTLTNQASAQARIKTIAVTYIDTSKVDGVSLTSASGQEKTVIYNLAGQRLGKMQKGINIVGGKKIAVK